MATIFGGDPTVLRAVESEVLESKSSCVYPLYIVLYIYDAVGIELTDAELKAASHESETAMYGLHVVGLVFLPKVK